MYTKVKTRGVAILVSFFVLQAVPSSAESQTSCSSSQPQDTKEPSAQALLQTAKSQIQVHLDDALLLGADDHLHWSSDAETAQLETSSLEESRSVQPSVGTTATLDEAGFQAVYSACCTREMEEFARRIIVAANLELCNEYGLLGLVPWYSCQSEAVLLQVPPQKKTYKDLYDNIMVSVPPAKCPFVAPTGQCPALSDECHGVATPQSHRRRACSAQKSSTTTAKTAASTSTTSTTTITTTTTTTTATTTTITTTTTATTTTITTATTTTRTTTSTSTTSTTTTTTLDPASKKRGLLLADDETTLAMLNHFNGKVSWAYNYGTTVNPVHRDWMNQNGVEFAFMVFGSFINLEHIPDGTRDPSKRCYFFDHARPNKPGNPYSKAELCTLAKVVAAMNATINSLTVPVRYIYGANEPWPGANIEEPIDEYVDEWRHFIQPAAEQLGLTLGTPTVRQGSNAVGWFANFSARCWSFRNNATFPCDLSKIKILQVHRYNCKASYWPKHFATPSGTMYSELRSAFAQGPDGKNDPCPWASSWGDWINSLPIHITEMSCEGEEKKNNGVVVVHAPDNTGGCERIAGQHGGNWGHGSVREIVDNLPNIPRLCWWPMYYNNWGHHNIMGGLHSRLVDGNDDLTPLGRAYLQPGVDFGSANNVVDCTNKSSSSP